MGRRSYLLINLIGRSHRPSLRETCFPLGNLPLERGNTRPLVCELILLILKGGLLQLCLFLCSGTVVMDSDLFAELNVDVF